MKTLNNTREMIEYVIKHLVEQGKQALDEEGDCQYLTDNGESCAVGCLLDKEHYNVNFEGVSIQYSPKAFYHSKLDGHVKDLQKAVTASTGLNLTKIRLGYLEALQRVHDTSGHDFLIDVKQGLKSKVKLGSLPKYTLEFINW